MFISSTASGTSSSIFSGWHVFLWSRTIITMQARIFSLLIMPSLLSGVLCLLLAAGILAGISWSYASQMQFFYDFLFGPTSIATSLVASPDIFGTFRHYVLASPATYYVVLVLSAALIALLTYELLQGVGQLARKAQDKAALQDALSLFGVRIASMAAWTVYTIVFVDVLIPYVESTASGSLTLLAAGEGSGWWYLVGGGLLLAAGLHMHVIFVRLTTQRLRLFSRVEPESY